MKSFANINILFPFIDRRFGGNGYSKKNSRYFKVIKDELKGKCTLFVKAEMSRNGIKCPFYGASLKKTYIFKRKGARDYDNFDSLAKYYQDSLVSNKLIEDDNCYHLKLLETDFATGHSEGILFEMVMFESKKDFNLMYEPYIRKVTNA